LGQSKEVFFHEKRVKKLYFAFSSLDKMAAVRRRGGREKELLQQMHRGLLQSLLPYTGRLPYQLEVSPYFLSVRRRRGREIRKCSSRSTEACSRACCRTLAAYPTS
jgi:hypothetical protein